jgi:hypothetical protein
MHLIVTTVALVYIVYSTTRRFRVSTPVLEARVWKCKARRPNAPKRNACRLSEAVTRFLPSWRWEGVDDEFT